MVLPSSFGVLMEDQSYQIALNNNDRAYVCVCLCVCVCVKIGMEFTDPLEIFLKQQKTHTHELRLKWNP